jgi:hypothetical protein
MAANSNDQEIKKFPDFPGEHVLAHEGAEWMKSAFAALAAARLAVTAETGDLLALEEIIDIPLSAMPMLAMGHRDFERRMVDRLKISQDNTRNHLKRRRLLWEAWDQLFQILHASTKRLAPLLHTMMWESCNLRAMEVLGGHFDGPLAWRILLSRINATERTKVDKLYYDSCLGIQKSNRLSDGCAADAFSKRAIAFVLHLMPNLAQKYT